MSKSRDLARLISGSGAALTGDLSVTGNIIPVGNNVYNLGSVGSRWKDLVISGQTIDLGGARISQDANSGTIALVAAPTVDNPSPKALVVTSTGGTVAIETTGGEVDFDIVANTVNTTVAFDGSIFNLSDIDSIGSNTAATIANGSIMKWNSANATFVFAAESGEVSNSYLSSTYVANAAFQSYVGNTNPRLSALEARPYIVTTNNETIAAISQTVVDSFPLASFRTAKYLVQVTHDLDNNRFQTSEVLLVHNGSAAFITEYGSVSTAGPIASIDADVSGGNVRLLVTPSYTNTTIETVRTTVSV